ncbi:MAG: extracellular solute-binding protein [Gammaproteobacteria bacterium]|nr:extracellular solute-binding protein [Gammaproteobacteria bacterium]
MSAITGNTIKDAGSSSHRYGMRLGLLLAVVLCLPVAQAAEDLTLVSWGGAYTKSQILAFVRPYEQRTDTRMEVLDYNGGLTELRNQVRSLNFRWDVVDLEMSDALRACEEGLLEPIHKHALAPAPDGTATREDFLSGSLTPCAVGTVIWSTALAYDPARLKQTPTRLEDFFDLERFPGPRGMRRTPKANLEWALIADGVPNHKVYEVLATEAGLNRAFEVLTRIKPHIVWWDAGLEAPRLLDTRRVVMTTAYTGRIHDSNRVQGTDYQLLWDHQIWNIDLFGVPRGNPRAKQAWEFIRFATATERLAEQARHIPYGPVRRSSLSRLTPNEREHLPTREANFKNAMQIDAGWWAKHYDRIRPRFDDWLAQPVQVPRKLPR